MRKTRTELSTGKALSQYLQPIADSRIPRMVRASSEFWEAFDLIVKSYGRSFNAVAVAALQKAIAEENLDE